MHPKTIDNLFIVNFQNDFSKLSDYQKAFSYTIEYLMPKAKNIYILYNGLEFTYYDDEEEKEVTFIPETFLDLISHYKQNGIHGLRSTPRIVNNNSITPLTKKIQIFPKTFYYIRPWINLGFSESEIIKAIENMFEDDYESMEIEGKFISLPNWFLDITDSIDIEEEKNNIIVGGKRDECIRELQFLFKAANIDYSINFNGVFGKD